ncbi:MAG: ribosome silencing factor [Campylobacteraceae bacterium]|jgi:nicotinate-nucleotide adenylyltransferase|nr:ribosome silencing factor [Campylobacteraceae bacterium]
MNKRINYIVKILEEKKAENIQVFDMSGKDYFVEQVIVATTMGERHGISLLDVLKAELKKQGENFLHIEAGSEWIVIDLSDILIHLLTPNFRVKYNLEEFLAKRNEIINNTETTEKHNGR